MNNLVVEKLLQLRSKVKQNKNKISEKHKLHSCSVCRRCCAVFRSKLKCLWDDKTGRSSPKIVNLHLFLSVKFALSRGLNLHSEYEKNEE